MADLSKTITNSLNLFGSEETNKWNVYNWNAFNWGEGSEDQDTIIGKWLDAETITFDSSVAVAYTLTIGNTLVMTSDRSDANLFSGDWNYVTRDGTTDFDDQANTTWAEDSDESETWTEASTSDVTWSES